MTNIKGSNEIRSSFFMRVYVHGRDIVINMFSFIYECWNIQRSWQILNHLVCRERKGLQRVGWMHMQLELLMLHSREKDVEFAVDMWYLCKHTYLPEHHRVGCIITFKRGNFKKRMISFQREFSYL